MHDPERFLDSYAAVKVLDSIGIKASRGGLAKWRGQAAGPPFRRFGRRILYLESELREWVALKISPTWVSTASDNAPYLMPAAVSSSTSQSRGELVPKDGG